METALTTTQTKALATIEPAAAELLADWRAALALRVAAGELAPATQETYQNGMARLVAFADGRNIDADLILNWKAALLAKGAKQGAINTWLSGVRAFYGWACGAGRMVHNPAAAVKGAKRNGTATRHKREALTDAEVLRVLAQPDPTTPNGKRDAAILYLMAYTAARGIELQRADLADLKTTGGRLTLAVRGKGRAEADEMIVIAHPDAEAALRDWLAVRGDEASPLFCGLGNRNRGRLTMRAIHGIVKAAFKAAGVVGNKTTHSLRHAAISAAVKRGAPIQKVQSMARHANISTTMIYYHEADRVENPAEEYISYKAAAKKAQPVNFC